MTTSLFLHVLGVVVWVGGMFFAYMALRPAAASILEPPARLALWAGVFNRFFPWVWASVVLILLSGLHMLMKFAAAGTPHYVWTMLVLGLVMMAIFAHIFFAPYARLRRAVAQQDWKAGGAALGQIRLLIGVNLSLGLLTIALAFFGRALALAS
ncbi:MAG TPA: CopD family protein [Thiobacillaceae bacterium]|nr:CopD family protein [Thiobacillaceae bacterium]